MAVKSDIGCGRGRAEEFCTSMLCCTVISPPESKKTRPNVNLRIFYVLRAVVWGLVSKALRSPASSSHVPVSAMLERSWGRVNARRWDKIPSKLLLTITNYRYVSQSPGQVTRWPPWCPWLLLTSLHWSGAGDGDGGNYEELILCKLQIARVNCPWPSSTHTHICICIFQWLCVCPSQQIGSTYLHCNIQTFCFVDLRKCLGKYMSCVTWQLNT